ncbi:MAG: penicillin-binding protein [bacterium]|nr:penicillin-binding protein [bacterium]
MLHIRSLWRHTVRLWKRIPPWLELSIIGVVAFFFIVLGATVVWATIAPIPAINNFENRQVAQSTKIYDRTGNIVLYDVHGSMRRTAVPIEKISPYIQKAAVAVEDETFYTNAGFRPLSFLRAIGVNVLQGKPLSGQGGSTITQQVVKNSLLTQDKTIARKIKEIILALRLTRVYTKDQILNTYLNESPYGGTIYGVQEASQYFFGVDAKDVDLAQAAYLAALPQAPTYYSPYGNHREALDERKSFVLFRMKESGFITDEEYAQAENEKVEFRDEAEAGIKAPHFVFYIREYLEQKYGADVVSNTGLHVVTTLDYDLQKKAEETVAKWAPDMQKNFNAENEGVVAIDPKSGQILAMVGSRGYFDETIDGKVNIALANRQPGSSFKPFVYAAAFEKGYTPETVVFDLKTQFSTRCAPSNMSDTPPCYSPENFDNTFKGPITLRNALAQSVNVPSVKTLYLTGISNALKMAKDLGITTLKDANTYGLTLVLGGGEVNLLEMTGAYGVFANDGVRNPPTGILRVEDSTGNVLESYREESARVLDQQIARLINGVLSDNVARTPEFGANSPLNFPGWGVADKTGTTNDFRDVWILGYTPSIAVGAWAGNNDNSQMVKKIAAFIIAPMWHEFMALALEKYSSQSDTFPAPSPDPDVAGLPQVLSGNWNTDPSQGVHDILYWIDKNNPRGGKPSNPASDPQFAYWDYSVSLWAGQQAAVGQPVVPNASPTGFHIASPQAGAVVVFGQPLIFSASAQMGTIVGVSYFVNGGLIGTTGQSPYSIAYIPNTRGPATLRAVAQHPDSSVEEQTITFTVQ